MRWELQSHGPSPADRATRVPAARGTGQPRTGSLVEVGDEVMGATSQ